MAKLKNVTLDEIKKAEDATFDVAQTVLDIYRRVSQGYADEISSPLRLAISFASASRSFAELSSWLLTKAALDEQRRELAAQMARRLNPSPAP